MGKKGGRTTYLRDGRLDLARRNIDKLSEGHPFKRGGTFQKRLGNKLLYCLILLAVLAVGGGSHWIYMYGFQQTGCQSSLQILPQKSPKVDSILEGRITHVRDGDTFEVNGQAVRISALDCPENSISDGQIVTWYAKKFKGKTARFELTGATTYDRVVGYCSIGGVDFGKTMMDNTSCKVWKKYDIWNRY